jgi:hypothetical protein
MKNFEKFDKKDIYKPLTIDPSIFIKGEIIELLDNILIKLQSNSENEKVVEGIFKVCIEKFRIDVVRDIMLTTIPEHKLKQLERKWIIGELLNKKEDKDEEES